MLRSTTRFKEYVRAQYQDLMRIADALPDKERKTLKELFKAALLASDSASSSSNALPNDMMLMLMLIQLENELDGIEEKLERNGRIVVRE